MFFQAQQKRFDKAKAISSLLGQVGGCMAQEAELHHKLLCQARRFRHTAAREFSGRKETGRATSQHGSEHSPRLIRKPRSGWGSSLCSKMSFSFNASSPGAISVHRGSLLPSLYPVEGGVKIHSTGSRFPSRSCRSPFAPAAWLMPLLAGDAPAAGGAAG